MKGGGASTNANDCPACRRSRHYPFKLVIFGKYHFEKPITLFSPLCQLTPLLCRPGDPPLSAGSQRIFTILPPARALHSAGVSLALEPTKVIPKSAQVMLLFSGKKNHPTTPCGT